MTPLEVSVIVPTNNRSDLLPGLFASLSRQTFPSHLWEMVIVDDGSSDDTLETIGRLAPTTPARVTTVSQPRKGSATARNSGADRAAGRILLFLDDDMIAMPTLVEEHAAAHDEPLLAVLGRISAPSDRKDHPWTVWEDKMFSQRSRSIEEGRRAPGPRDFYSGNFSISAELFAAVAGFNASLNRTHDLELGYRLKAAGAAFAYRARAESIHRGSHTFDRWLQSAEALGESELVLGWELGHTELQTDLFEWFLNRHPLNRVLVRLCLRQPWLERPLVASMDRVGRLSHRLNAVVIAHAAYSGIFNLVYWMRIVTAIGPDTFRREVERARDTRVRRT